MRRILSAVLVSLITASVLPAVPVGASEPSPAPARAALPPSRKALAERAALSRQDAVADATERALAFTAAAVQTTSAALRTRWEHVAICEVGGNWSMVGPTYSGIGFLNATWAHYGGTKYAPLAGEASEDQQIIIGMRVTGGYVPDQGGCNPGGW
jgi:hypothetical protein